ncbi:hypothetical protein [Streptosporangium nondiastaticum]|nr:hypothetical protein [Streptosporangium nondiastaticum]
MRRAKVAVLVVTMTVMLLCAFTPPGAGRHRAPTAPRSGVPAGGFLLLTGAAIVAGGAALGLLGLVCNRPRQRTG